MPESQIVKLPFGSSVGSVVDVESRASTHPGKFTIGRPMSTVTGAMSTVTGALIPDTTGGALDNGLICILIGSIRIG
jgi:hypothetical protein